MRNRPSRRLRRARALCAAFASALFLFGGPRPASPAPPVDEATLKATFVYKFALFVEWPESSAAAEPTFTFCTAGSAEFLRSLEATVASKSVRDRPIVARAVESPEQVSGCRLLFVAEAKRERIDRLLEGVGPRPVLTIGEQEGFAARGGMINLVREGKNLRFEINQAAIQRAGLRASSQLMKVSRAVEELGTWP